MTTYSITGYRAGAWDFAYAVFPVLWHGGLGSPNRVQHATLASAQAEADRLNALLAARTTG